MPDQFVRDRSRSGSGVKRVCRDCEADRSRRYYRRQREKVLARAAEKHVAAKGPRMCAKGCGRKATSQRHVYCAICRAEAQDLRLQRRGEMSAFRLGLARELDACRAAKRKAEGLSTSRRGYGAGYQAVRKRLAPVVASGVVRCSSPDCQYLDEEGRNGLIGPGEPWDLGHDEFRRIRGPEHRRCNRRTAALRAA
jgi:hypothetical protein